MAIVVNPNEAVVKKNTSMNGPKNFPSEPGPDNTKQQ
jgi:hypothetical protein